MKTIAMILAMLIVLTAIPLAEARTDRTQTETWNQRLISHIHFKSNRLRTFCSESEITADAYKMKVCKSGDGACRSFMAKRWNEWCSQRVEGSIRNYDYKAIFDSQREYIREHNLPLLRNRRDEIVTIAEPIVEDTLVIPEQATGINPGRQIMHKRKMMVA